MYFFYQILAFEICKDYALASKSKVMMKKLFAALSNKTFMIQARLDLNFGKTFLSASE